MTGTPDTPLGSLDRSALGTPQGDRGVFAVGEHEDDERPADGTDESASEVPTTGVRVAHLAPGAPNVDIYVDGDRVVSDVAYDELTPYLALEPGSYPVTITAAGDEDAVVYDDEIVVGNAFYTVAALERAEGEGAENEVVRIQVLTDSGSTLLRLVHAAPGAPAVDVLEAESESRRTVFEGVAFGRRTAYVALPAGSYALEVVPAASKTGRGVDDGESEGPTDDEEGERSTADEENEGETGNGSDESTVDDASTDETGTRADTDPITTVTLDLESHTAYTAFAEGSLEQATDGDDREFSVHLTEDGPAALEAPETAEGAPGEEGEIDEGADGDDDSADGTADSDERDGASDD